MEAVRLVRQGWSMRKVARHMGFHHTAIMRWMRRVPYHATHILPTRSSRPHHHPRELKEEVIAAIVAEREKHHRSSEVLYEDLKVAGILVSLSSIKRTLKRKGLLRTRSPWKRRHMSEERPRVFNAGDLVQMDTIHIMISRTERIYVYTLIDLYSRWAYAGRARRSIRGSRCSLCEEPKLSRHSSSRCSNLIMAPNGVPTSRNEWESLTGIRESGSRTIMHILRDSIGVSRKSASIR